MTLRPEPSTSRFSRFKSWFSFRLPSHNKDNSDPTYGFGNRCSSQTYFKTSNVDSSIPNDVDFKMALAGMLGGEHCSSLVSMPSTINTTTTTTPEAKDVLFPLRTSLEAASSSKKRKQQQDDDETSTHSQGTKRVKFDDKEDVASESFFERRQKLHAEQYQENYVPMFKPQPVNHHHHQMTLKDRIVDFFTKLI